MHQRLREHSNYRPTYQRGMVSIRGHFVMTSPQKCVCTPPLPPLPHRHWSNYFQYKWHLSTELSYITESDNWTKLFKHKKQGYIKRIGLNHHRPVNLFVTISIDPYPHGKVCISRWPLLARRIGHIPITWVHKLYYFGS